MNADEPAASPAANGSFAKMRELFDRARDLPTEDRTAFLEPQCAGDHGLLAVVRQLLG